MWYNLKMFKQNIIKSISSKIIFAAVLVVGPLSAQTSFAQSAFEDPGARNSAGNNNGGLVSVNDNLDSGSITLGSSSQVVLLFRNDGGKDISMGAIDLYPSSNVSASIAQNQCAAEPLESGAICAIALSVKGLQPGRFRVEMLIRHDGRSRLITSTVSGLVDSTDDSRTELINDIEAIPNEIDFGSLSESRTQVESIILRNVTSKRINLSNVSIQSTPQSGFTLDSDCDSLDSGQACIATVTWSPIQRGPASGVLVVDHDGPAAVTGVTLKGAYEPSAASEAEIFPEAIPGKGLLTASQSEVDFGTGIETSSAITVSLVNVGDAPILLNDIRLSNDKNGIEISRNGCAPGTMLDPVEACPLTLTWEPVREGEILDDIQIRHDGARGILVIPLRGEATQAVNRDSEAILLGGDSTSLFGNVPAISSSVLGIDDIEGAETNGATSSSDPTASAVPTPAVDVRGVLDGYRVTSLASRRAIIAGPGGSRVVFDGEETVIGGVLWTVGVRSSAVKFAAGEQQVLLLFDKSLTSFNANSSESNSSDNSNSDTDN
ncbi:MAG: choice-of-anchor D domain-containing protein [Pseudomonadota bacterium]